MRIPTTFLIAAAVTTFALPVRAAVEEGPDRSIYERAVERVMAEASPPLDKQGGDAGEDVRLRIVEIAIELVEHPDFVARNPEGETFRKRLLSRLPRCGLEPLDLGNDDRGAFNLPEVFCDLYRLRGNVN